VIGWCYIAQTGLWMDEKLTTVYTEILLELGTLGAEEMIKQLTLILAHTAQEVAACTDLCGKEQ